MDRCKKPQAEAGPSAPMWMITFSDCMNLLLTFFVVLVTFSSYDTDTRKSIRMLGGSFRRALSIGDYQVSPYDNSALTPTSQILTNDAPAEGAEKPTSVSPPLRKEGALQQEPHYVDYRDRKAFVVPSKDVFLGKGAVLSGDGRYLLAVMASFLKEMPGRVVVSENGPQQGTGKYAGLPRAWAVVEYLSTLQNLDKTRFSISDETALVHKDLENTQSDKELSRGERMLEIVLLERRLHN